MDSARRYTLTLSCPDQVGIVASVSTFIAQHCGWIVEANHHADQDNQRFFMRQEILAKSLPFDLVMLRQKFTPIAEQYDMQWHISDSAMKKQVVILVSKLGHCLSDLLGRWRGAELDMEIPCVISNHEDQRSFVEWHGIPFHHIPVTAQTRERAFEEIARHIDTACADTVVLARYMQILPAALCARYAGRVINIHHSFLPSFSGANAYHQAYERGVKLIGATCHYVTAELDAGPIVDQDLIRIDHSDSVEDLVRYGRDIEKTVLARGLRYHLEDRVLLSGNRTVVFR